MNLSWCWAVKLSTRPFSANKKLHFFITISDAPFVYTLDHVSQDKDKECDKEEEDKDKCEDKYHNKKDCHLKPPLSRGMMVLIDLRAELNV